MKRAILIIISCGICLTGFSQEKTSVQVTPVSFKGWGVTPSTVSIQVQHRWVMAGYYYMTRTYWDEWNRPTRRQTVGLFFKPPIQVSKWLIVSPIAGVYNHKFPTENSAWWAFGLSVELKLRRVGIYYQHLSNAWTAKFNPGIDGVGLKYSLRR